MEVTPGNLRTRLMRLPSSRLTSSEEKNDLVNLSIQQRAPTGGQVGDESRGNADAN